MLIETNFLQIGVLRDTGRSADRVVGHELTDDGAGSAARAVGQREANVVSDLTHADGRGGKLGDLACVSGMNQDFGQPFGGDCFGIRDDLGHIGALR